MIVGRVEARRKGTNTTHSAHLHALRLSPTYPYTGSLNFDRTQIREGFVPFD